MEGAKTFSDYSKKYMLVDAAERRLAIIGEALWKASKLNKNILITDQKKINWIKAYSRA